MTLYIKSAFIYIHMLPYSVPQICTETHRINFAQAHTENGD